MARFAEPGQAPCIAAMLMFGNEQPPLASILLPLAIACRGSIPACDHCGKNDFNRSQGRSSHVRACPTAAAVAPQDGPAQERAALKQQFGRAGQEKLILQGLPVDWKAKRPAKRPAARGSVDTAWGLALGFLRCCEKTLHSSLHFLFHYPYETQYSPYITPTYPLYNP